MHVFKGGNRPMKFILISLKIIAGTLLQAYIYGLKTDKL